MWPFNRLSIFWKIFGWFWLTLFALVFLSLFVWSFARDNVIFHPADPMSAKHLERISKIIGSGAHPEKVNWQMRKYLERFQRHRNMKDETDANAKMFPVYLIDENGTEFEGKEIPETLQLLFRKTQHLDQPFTAIQGDQLFIGPEFVMIDGTEYRMFFQKKLGMFRMRVLHHLLYRTSAWIILGFLIISGILCFFLAWSITRPLKKMQWVTQQIARGKAVSAVDEMGGRRDEFLGLAEDFDLMSNKILETVETQKQLLSDVSHELRSPLTRLSIATGILAKKVTGEQSKDIKRIEKECERMDEMITQLLDIAALERGRIYETEDEFDFNHLIEDILRDVEFEAQASGVSISHSMNVQCLVSGHYNLIHSAIENILRNAIRFSNENGLVEIKCEMNPDSDLVFIVKDNGPGIDEKALKSIFLPFFRADESRSRNQGGIGLGLAIASKAIELHHGSIDAENVTPTGLKVSITIPRYRCSLKGAK